MKEIWKPTLRSNLYQVSNFGQVKRNEKILKPGYSRAYQQVAFCINGKRKFHRIHQLVAEVFIGPCPSGYEVDHIDKNPKNNHVSNLRYKTIPDNRRDKYKKIIGLSPTGEIKKFNSVNETAAFLNCCASNVSAALRGRSKKCKKWKLRYE
jgi:hypothetical protein